MRSIKEYLIILIKGMGMGAADVVPGVSGGTIALITGIYSELLHSLKNLGPDALVVLFKEGIPATWKYINGNFLLAVFGGILISVKTFAAIIGFCLENYPLLVWGFFSGLILSSVLLLVRQQKGWRIQHWLTCLLGMLVVVFVSMAKPAQLPGDLWILFFGGFIAICAMILPGISGSFILLLMGLYQVVLQAVNDLDFVAIGVFMVGCVCGLLVFSRFLSWLLDRYYTLTLSLLIGFLIGSLNVTWPWKTVVESFVNRHGETVPLLQKNVSPMAYEFVANQSSQLFMVLLFAVLGFLLVLIVDIFGAKISKK